MGITLKDISQLDGGAQFLRADMHIHTYGGSADVHDSAMTVESITDTLFAQKISIIAITDHNSDLNTQKSLEYAKKYNGRMLVLPGVELSTANGHLLAYFALERASSVRDLLARIKLIGNPGEKESHTQMSMADVIHEVELLGGISVAAHIDREKTGFNRIVDGYPNWKKDIISCSGLYGLEFDDPHNLPWYSSNDDPTPDGAERKKLLASRAQLPKTAARISLAPLQNSDAHSLKQLTKPRELTRIKMSELSFESLRTALVDPEARIRPTAVIPPVVPRIIGIHFNGGFLDGGIFHFSNNLNCFIGGRGTGKSTAIQSVAYGLGITDAFSDHDNCADSLIIYCKDGNGILYRYDRTRGCAPVVRAKEDESIRDVPTDAFRIEYFGQGELAEVAKDPLKNPSLLQEFLDRHISIDDLTSQGFELLSSLRENSAQIIPLGNTAAQLPAKKASLKNLETKLKIAETGKVKEIAAFQIKLAAEKDLTSELLDIATLYENGLLMTSFLRDYETLAATAGELSNNKDSIALLVKARDTIEKANLFLEQEQAVVNSELKKIGKELRGAVAELTDRHNNVEQAIGEKIADLRKQGLSGTVQDLNTLIRQKTALTSEISRIESQGPHLRSLVAARAELLQKVDDLRAAIMERRKGQLSTINRNLGSTIRDYAVNLHYDPTGIIDLFKKFFMDVKQIPVNQMSDGQKHTILLTIAMLSESNVPLMIDQPEDDLDNAFIFDSVVSTLRSIKERRQVILVTHNANIAVLGDSELIFPMKRSGEKGVVVNRGSIDRIETKKSVQEILEGGELAFRPRKEIYGH